MSISRSDNVMEALFDVILEAPDYDRNKLFDAMKTFREEVSRSYAAVRKQPFARKMIDAIEDAEKFINDANEWK